MRPLTKRPFDKCDRENSIVGSRNMSNEYFLVDSPPALLEAVGRGMISLLTMVNSRAAPTVLLEPRGVGWRELKLQPRRTCVSLREKRTSRKSLSSSAVMKKLT